MNWLIWLNYRVKTIAALIGVKNRVDWTLQDKSNFRAFLKTQSGQRFIHQIRNGALEATARAVTVNSSPLFARGWQTAFAYVCRLAAVDPLQVIPTGEVSLTEEPVSEKERKEQESLYTETTDRGLGFPIGYPVAQSQTFTRPQL